MIVRGVNLLRFELGKLSYFRAHLRHLIWVILTNLLFVGRYDLLFGGASRHLKNVEPACRDVFLLT